MFTALKLSFNNLRTKKGRTFLTAFASSIGIIGIAVILSLSTGFQSEIDKFQSNAMAEFPIIISKQTQEINAEEMKKMRSRFKDEITGNHESTVTDNIVIIDSRNSIIKHKNDFSDTFINYIENVSPDIVGSIGYTRIVNMNLIRQTEEGFIPVTFGSSTKSNMQSMNNMTSTSNMGISSYPDSISENENYLKDNYDLVAGEYPNSETDVVLIVDSKNQIEKSSLDQLGYGVENKETIAFDQVIGTEFKVVGNNDFYAATDFGYYVPSKDYKAMYQSENGFTIKISGVIRAKEDSRMSLLTTGIAYSDKLSQRIIEDAKDSDIVKAQKESGNNVMTGEELDEDAKSLMLAYLGGDPSPYMIMMYPRNFEAKDQVIQYIEDYNTDKTDAETINYTDLAGTVSEMTKDIMDGITVVLIALAAISLVVSMIMISIITYTSVLERTKEIGILKALGARKKDITRVFDAETIILGVFSGVLGVTIAWLLTFPVNGLINNMTGLTNASHLKLDHAVLLVIISTVITVLGGHIPAKMASKKDAVEALRSE